jgi:hypothetical protein
VLHVDPLLGVGQKLELLGIDHACVRVCSYWIYWMHSSAWLNQTHLQPPTDTRRPVCPLDSHIQKETEACVQNW